MYFDIFTNKYIGENPSPLSFYIKVDTPLKKIEKYQEEVYVEKQKVNEAGIPLYLHDLEETIEPIYFTQHTMMKPYEPIYNQIEEVDEEGNTFYRSELIGYQYPQGEEFIFSDVPGEYEYQYEIIHNNPPIIEVVTELVEKEREITNPAEFSLEEIIRCKFEQIMREKGYYYAYADEFINEEDIDLSFPEHLANSGVKFLQLLPYGKCRLKLIELEFPTNIFEMYTEMDEGIEVEARNIKRETIIESVEIEGETQEISREEISYTEDPTAEVELTFVNTTDKPKNIHAYILMYKEGE
jgi:hypothetical protein